MLFSRRSVLSIFGGLTASAVTAGAGVYSAMVNRNQLSAEISEPLSNLQPMVLPKALQKSQCIGVVCPASGVQAAEIKSFASLCTSRGYKLKFGKNVSKRKGYLSATDEDRASEFMAFVNDPEVDAIVCGRGGYGVMRILPMLDYSKIREARKIIMGFSDITALLIAIERNSRLVCFHGPVASSTFDSFTVSSLTDVVLASDNGKDEQENMYFQDDRVTTLTAGIAQGKLTGGNLAMIVATLGTRYEIDTKDSILFLEEINEEPYRVDRMLTQLWLAGKLQQCAGIALGNFRDCESKGLSISGPSFTLMEVLQQRIVSLGIPAVYGLPFGHVRSKLTLPLGVLGELDATGKSIRLLEQAVA